MRLEVGEKRAVSISLTVGSVRQGVDVTATSEVLHTSDASVGEVVEPQALVFQSRNAAPQHHHRQATGHLQKAFVGHAAAQHDHAVHLPGEQKIDGFQFLLQVPVTADEDRVVAGSLERAFDAAQGAAVEGA